MERCEDTIFVGTAKIEIVMEIEKLPIKDALSKNEIEVVQKRQQEFHIVGRMRSVPGHKLFCYNRKTGEIKEAETNSYAVMNMDGTSTLKREVKIDKYCFYEQALNRKNFIKRLKRYGVIQ